MLLATFADLYRHELGAEEDVYRTLPFFGTALGLVIGSLAYAGARLPRWSDAVGQGEQIALAASGVLLGLAIAEAGLVLYWLGRAIAWHDYRQIGPEPALQARLASLRADLSEQAVTVQERDSRCLEDMRQTLLNSYASVTPINRAFNQRRTTWRARASSHLVRSLI